jgi:ankyrin repeat protein
MREIATEQTNNWQNGSENHTTAEYSPIFTRKEVKIVEDSNFQRIEETSEFINRCTQEFEKNPTFRDIAIEPYKKIVLSADKLIIPSKGLSFTISNQDIFRLMNQMIEIVINPKKVALLLKPLDDALSESMKSSGINFTENELPQYLIAGMGHYMPGPPPSDYQPWMKARLLDNLLLAREKSVGINIEGYTPKFVGLVPQEKGNDFVSQGHLFAEDVQVSRLLVHGKYSHRLIFEVFRSAIKSNQINLTITNGTELSFRQLLELLVSVQYESNSLWQVILDTVSDIVVAVSNNDARPLLDPDNYNFSCRSPLVLMSLILCFGNELELPHLQHYLLDSHWKEAYCMVGRIIHEELDALSQTKKDVIYTYCMEALSTPRYGGPGEFGVWIPFEVPLSIQRYHSKYQPYKSESDLNIFKKELSTHPVGRYKTWDEYIIEKKNEEEKQIDPVRAFIDSCKIGKLETIISLLSKYKLSLNVVWYGFNQSINNNQVRIVDFIINDEKTKSYFDKIHLEFPLAKAAEKGYNDIIRILLAANVNINFANDMKIRDYNVIRSPLINAVKNGHLETVKLLLDNNINFEHEFSPFHGNTALTTAIKYRHKEIANLLLDLKPSGQWLMTKNSDGKNADDLAKAQGWDDISDRINDALNLEKKSETISAVHNIATATNLSMETHVDDSSIAEITSGSNIMTEAVKTTGQGSSYGKIFSPLNIKNSNKKQLENLQVTNKQGNQSFFKSTSNKSALSAVIITGVVIIAIALTLGTFGLGIFAFVGLCAGLLITNTIIGALIGKVIERCGKSGSSDIHEEKQPVSQSAVYAKRPEPKLHQENFYSSIIGFLSGRGSATIDQSSETITNRPKNS